MAQFELMIGNISLTKYTESELQVVEKLGVLAGLLGPVVSWVQAKIKVATTRASAM